MTRRVDLVTIEVLTYGHTVLIPDPPFVSLHSPLLYAFSPGLHNKIICLGIIIIDNIWRID